MLKSTGKFLLHDGFSIAYQRWNAGATRQVLAMHGWLDNSNSFHLLAPVLAERGFDVVAIDHAGHGHSSHAPFGAILSSGHYIEHAICVMDALCWEKPNLLGHSMGAITAAGLAAAFPERVDKLALIEGLGRVTKSPSVTAHTMRHGIEMRMKTSKRTTKTSKIHDSFESAVESRVKTVASFPGKQYLHRDAAAAIVSRATVSVDFPDRADEEDTSSISGRVQFRHDPRLFLPNEVYFTPEQNNAVVSAIESQTLLITAENGWPFHSKDFVDQALTLESKNLLHRKHFEEGSHHPHMHPTVATELAHDVATFLSSSETS